jgi:DHA1 family multidrug resistance protein-like MFS transporter
MEPIRSSIEPASAAPGDDTTAPLGGRRAYDWRLMSLPHRPLAPVASWIDRWAPILPLLVAEFVVWLGFGSLLPVMPIYFRDHGVDLATLGVVVAAWPAARLVGEPIFGYVADRTRRVPLMVAGNVGAGIFQFLPLVFIGPLPFLILRGLQGLSTAVYDPAARGYITDATPPARHGEAFGLYGAAQMGGLLFGPAIGGLGAAAFGGIGFVFVFGGISSFVAATLIAFRVREQPHGIGTRTPASYDAAEFPPRPPIHDGDDEATEPGMPVDPRRPLRLANRLLYAAIVINLGGNFAAGTYDVVWSIFLDGLGANPELIGLTFAMFGLPILVLSPYFGRRVDRGGLVGFVIIGGLAPAVTGVLYTLLVDPALAVPLILIEATGFAMLNPALYAIVAAGSPRGRSSTAQGVFGASGTVGFVVASLSAGVLAENDIRLPFFVFSAVMLITLVAGLAIGGRSLGGVGGRRVDRERRMLDEPGRI